MGSFTYADQPVNNLELMMMIFSWSSFHAIKQVVEVKVKYRRWGASHCTGTGLLPFAQQQKICLRLYRTVSAFH